MVDGCVGVENWKTTSDRVCVCVCPDHPLVRRVLRADGGDDRGGTPGAVHRPPHHCHQQHLRDAHLGGEAVRAEQDVAPSGARSET